MAAPVSGQGTLHRCAAMQEYNTPASQAAANTFAGKIDLVWFGNGLSFLPGMVTTNPDLEAGPYAKGIMFQGQTSGNYNGLPTDFPEDWYTHSALPVAKANRVASTFGPSIWIMDPTSTATWTDTSGEAGPVGTVYHGFRDFHKHWLETRIKSNANYTMTFADSLGTQSLNNQINESTGAAETQTTWFAKLNDFYTNASTGVYTYLKSKGLELYPNGLVTNASTYNYGDGAMLENALRQPSDGTLAAYSSTTLQTKFSTHGQRMMDTQLAGKKALPLTQILSGSGMASGSAAIDAWTAYTAACAYLFDLGKLYWDMNVLQDSSYNIGTSWTRDLKTPMDTVAPTKISDLQLKAGTSGNLYGRRYLRGFALVNTSSAAISYTLPRSDYLKAADGTAQAASISVPARSGIVLYATTDDPAASGGGGGGGGGTTKQYVGFYGADTGGGFAQCIALDTKTPGLYGLGGDTWGSRVTTTHGNEWLGSMAGQGQYSSGPNIRAIFFSKRAATAGVRFYGQGGNTTGGGFYVALPGSLYATELDHSNNFALGKPGGGSGTPEAKRPCGQLIDSYVTSGDAEYIFTLTASGLHMYANTSTAAGLATKVGAIPSSPANLLTTAQIQNWPRMFLEVLDATHIVIINADHDINSVLQNSPVYLVKTTASSWAGATSANTTATLLTLPSPVTHVYEIHRGRDGVLYAACGYDGVYTVVLNGTGTDFVWTKISGTFTDLLVCSVDADSAGNVYAGQTGGNLAGSYDNISNGMVVGHSIAKRAAGTNVWSWPASGGAVKVTEFQVGDTTAGTGRTWWLSSQNNVLSQTAHDVSMLRVDPFDDNIILLCGRAGGWSSRDGGASWYPCMNGLNGGQPSATGTSIRATGGLNVLASNTDFGAASSTDALLTAAKTTWVEGSGGTKVSPSAPTTLVGLDGATYVFTPPSNPTPATLTKNGIEIQDDRFQGAVVVADSMCVTTDGTVCFMQNGGGTFVMRLVDVAGSGGGGGGGTSAVLWDMDFGVNTPSTTPFGFDSLPNNVGTGATMEVISGTGGAGTAEQSGAGVRGSAVSITTYNSEKTAGVTKPGYASVEIPWYKIQPVQWDQYDTTAFTGFDTMIDSAATERAAGRPFKIGLRIMAGADAPVGGRDTDGTAVPSWMVGGAAAANNNKATDYMIWASNDGGARLSHVPIFWNPDFSYNDAYLYHYNNLMTWLNGYLNGTTAAGNRRADFIQHVPVCAPTEVGSEMPLGFGSGAASFNPTVVINGVTYGNGSNGAPAITDIGPVNRGSSKNHMPASIAADTQTAQNEWLANWYHNMSAVTIGGSIAPGDGAWMRAIAINMAQVNFDSSLAYGAIFSDTYRRAKDIIPRCAAYLKTKLWSGQTNLRVWPPNGDFSQPVSTWTYRNWSADAADTMQLVLDTVAPAYPLMWFQTANSPGYGGSRGMPPSDWIQSATDAINTYKAIFLETYASVFTDATYGATNVSATNGAIMTGLAASATAQAGGGAARGELHVKTISTLTTGPVGRKLVPAGYTDLWYRFVIDDFVAPSVIETYLLSQPSGGSNNGDLSIRVNTTKQLVVRWNASSAADFTDTAILVKGDVIDVRHVLNGATSGYELWVNNALRYKNLALTAPAASTISFANIGLPNAANAEAWFYRFGAATQRMGTPIPTGTASNTDSPLVTIVTPANGTVYTTSGSKAVTATASDNDGISLVEVSVDGGAWSTMAASGSQYTANVSLAGAPGVAQQHTISVRATDAYSDVTKRLQTVVSTVVTVNVVGADTTPPVLNVTTPVADATVSNATTTQAFAGTATDNVGVTSMKINSVVMTLGAGGSFSASFGLNVGNNVFMLVATDAAGNSTTVVRTITRQAVVALSPPTLTLTQPSDGQTYPKGTTSVPVAGSAADSDGTIVSVTFSLDGGNPSPLVLSAGAFNQQVTLAAGSHTIVVTATDNDGLTATKAVNITIPLDVSGGDGGGSSSQGSVTIAGKHGKVLVRT